MNLKKLRIRGPVRYEFAPDDKARGPKEELGSNLSGPWILDLHRRPSDRRLKSKSSRSKTIRTGRSPRGKDNRDVQRKRGKCKVERLPDGKLTCSHPGWRLGVECWHVRKVRAILGISCGPYSLARRRPATRWLFDSDPSEETRRCHARIEAFTRIPAMLAELCDRHIPIPKRSGRTGLSARAAIYSLGIKVFSNCSYAALLGRIATDVNFGAIAPNWFDNVPTIQTLCRRFGDEALSSFIEFLIAATARPARKLDRTVIIDSDSIPTVMSANSRNQKFGGPPPTWRAVAAMVKRHFAVGDVTGLVGAVDITLNEGLGSGDGPHFLTVAQKARMIFKNAENFAGDRAYSLRRNFTEAERLRFDLYVPEKANERRLDARKPWPELARRMTRLQRENPRRYNEVSRYRSKSEFVPSSSKRRYPYLRLRPRKTDAAPQYPAGLSFGKDDDYDQAISNLDAVTIAAIMTAAQTAVGSARLNEASMTILLENLYRLVTLENLFDQRVDFGNPGFAFDGVRLVSESDLQVKVNEHKRPLDDLHNGA
ncbi:MAG: hypothetical protein WB609_10275 [Candidatus Cybelea sp.]